MEIRPHFANQIFHLSINIRVISRNGDVGWTPKSYDLTPYFLLGLREMSGR